MGKVELLKLRMSNVVRYITKPGGLVVEIDRIEVGRGARCSESGGLGKTGEVGDKRNEATKEEEGGCLSRRRGDLEDRYKEPVDIRCSLYLRCRIGRSVARQKLEVFCVLLFAR